jgi:2-dehydropantoate 2-reductase
MRIAILGAGGVGGYDGAVLARAGNEVQLLARGQHLEAIRTGGLRISEADGSSWVARVDATDDPAALRGAELVLVTVKSYDLDAIAPVAADLARHGATVVPFLNGVDAADRLEQLGAPRQTLLGGSPRSAPSAPARGRSCGGARSIPRSSVSSTAPLCPDGRDCPDPRRGGHRDPRQRRDPARAVAEARLHHHHGTCCGLARTSIGSGVGCAAGSGPPGAGDGRVGRGRAGPWAFGFASDELARVLEQVRSMVADGMKPSFLLDLERGGPTELDVLSGAVSRHGRQVGVPTPVHDAAVAAFGAALGLKA